MESLLVSIATRPDYLPSEVDELQPGDEVSVVISRYKTMPDIYRICRVSWRREATGVGGSRTERWYNYSSIDSVFFELQLWKQRCVNYAEEHDMTRVLNENRRWFDPLRVEALKLTREVPVYDGLADHIYRRKPYCYIIDCCQLGRFKQGSPKIPIY